MIKYRYQKEKTFNKTEYCMLINSELLYDVLYDERCDNRALFIRHITVNSTDVN